ncbi:MAG: hypothetical protein RSD41_06855 [Kiritimatiellia bacterium]
MMARRLNIERRRKRIRHYTERRRQRSPVRRAFTYWWATVLLLTMTLGCLAMLIVATNPFGRGAMLGRGRYALPFSGLRLVRAPAAEVAAIVRAGNAKRLAGALSDEDIGISLKTLPVELAQLDFQPLPPLALGDMEAVRVSEVHLVPPFVPQPEVRKDRAIRARFSPLLLAANYRLFAEFPAPKGTRGEAIFEIVLDDNGIPESVLRLRPKGNEDDWLRALRMVLASGRGQGSAAGRITIDWNTESSAP